MIRGNKKKYFSKENVQKIWLKYPKHLVKPCGSFQPKVHSTKAYYYNFFFSLTSYWSDQLNSSQVLDK